MATTGSSAMNTVREFREKGYDVVRVVATGQKRRCCRPVRCGRDSFDSILSIDELGVDLIVNIVWVTFY